jgi:hypothetical protein
MIRAATTAVDVVEKKMTRYVPASGQCQLAG